MFLKIPGLEGAGWWNRWATLSEIFYKLLKCASQTYCAKKPGSKATNFLIEWFCLHDIQEKAKLQRCRTDVWLPGVMGRGGFHYKGIEWGNLGDSGTVLYPTCGDGYLTWCLCQNYTKRSTSYCCVNLKINFKK